VAAPPIGARGLTLRPAIRRRGRGCAVAGARLPGGCAAGERGSGVMPVGASRSKVVDPRTTPGVAPADSMPLRASTRQAQPLQRSGVPGAHEGGVGGEATPGHPRARAGPAGVRQSRSSEGLCRDACLARDYSRERQGRAPSASSANAGVDVVMTTRTSSKA
jgi:hypothetical protein